MKIACGECFSWAWQLTKNSQSAVLVHATVTHPWEKTKFAHAWVELDGLVYDWQSQVIRKTEPVTIEKFNQIWKPENVRKFSKEEALVNLVKEKHYGPWNRKNPDESVRQTIRTSQQTFKNQLSDKAKAAILRTGQIPAPDSIQFYDRDKYELTAGDIEERTWLSETPYPHGIHGKNCLIVWSKKNPGFNEFSEFRFAIHNTHGHYDFESITIKTTQDIWNYPEIVDAIRNLLLIIDKPIERRWRKVVSGRGWQEIIHPGKQRNNPDYDIRHLERRALESNKAEDILNYWHAALRANLLPRPTHQDESTQIWTLDTNNYYVVRHLGQIPEAIPYYQYLQRRPRIEIKTIAKLTNYFIPNSITDEDLILSNIKDILRWLLTIYDIEMGTACKACGSVGKQPCRTKKGNKKTAYYPHTNRYLTYNNMTPTGAAPFRGQAKFPIFPTLPKSFAHRQNPDKQIRESERGDDELRAALEKLRAGIILEPNSVSEIVNTAGEDCFEAQFNFGLRTITIQYGPLGGLPVESPATPIAVRLIAQDSRGVLRPWMASECNNCSAELFKNAIGRRCKTCGAKLITQPFKSSELTFLFDQFFSSGEVWQQPEVINAIYEALIASIETTRSNPDEKIRNLERSGGDNEIQTAIEKLRAGIVLEPTELNLGPYPQFDDLLERIAIFRFGPRQITVRWPVESVEPYEPEGVVSGAFRVSIDAFDRRGKVSPYPPLFLPGIDKVKFSDTEFVIYKKDLNEQHEVWLHPRVIEAIYTALIASIDQYWIKNPDDKIRRLIRDSEQSGKSWAAQLRAGQLPEPSDKRLYSLVGGPDKSYWRYGEERNWISEEKNVLTVWCDPRLNGEWIFRFRIVNNYGIYDFVPIIKPASMTEVPWSDPEIVEATINLLTQVDQIILKLVNKEGLIIHPGDRK